MAFQSNRSPFSQVRWVEFRNTSAEAVPSHGVIQISGSTVGSGRVTLTAGQPSGLIDMARIAVNSHQTVPAGGYGRCTYMSPSVVRKAVSDGTAVAGTLWGPKVSSWELHLNEAGFSSLGGDIGPVALFSRKTGVGSAGGAVLAQTSLIIPARQGNFLLGGPTEVQPVTHDGAGVVSNFGDPINVWSWVRSPSADPNDEPTGYLYVWIELGSDGFWYWTGEDCPVIDQGDPQQIQQSGFQMTGNTNTLIIAPP